MIEVDNTSLWLRVENFLVKCCIAFPPLLNASILRAIRNSSRTIYGRQLGTERQAPGERLDVSRCTAYFHPVREPWPRIGSASSDDRA